MRRPFLVLSFILTLVVAVALLVGLQKGKVARDKHSITFPHTCSRETDRILTTTAQFIPRVEDAEVVGWAIVKLDPEGPWAGMGFQEKDVIRLIRGTFMPDTTAFLAAIESLCGKDATVAFTRMGKQQWLGPFPKLQN